MEKTIDLEFAQKIISYRAKNNLSMKKFAELCGVTFQTIWLIESGRTNPTRLTRQKIINILEKGE